jgi:membrane fusion protein, copper/silver efflux system
MTRTFYYILFLFLFAISCNNKQQQTTEHEHADIYTCPMHPQIIRDKPGNCPICGMALVKKEEEAEAIKDVPLEVLLKPTNQYVVSTIPVTTLEEGIEQSTITALGTVQYDNRQLGTVSSRIEGRIERLYVKYRYQYVSKGDKILDIYSPELMTSQENFLFVIKHDAENSSIINAARQRLFLLGMSAAQVSQIARSGKPLYGVSVYSNYSGYVNHAGFVSSSNRNGLMGFTQSQNSTATTEELLIKEGMYLTKGQPIFSIINAGKALILLNIFANEQAQIKIGMPVKITPETAPDKSFAASISFIEPFYRQESKTLSARVYFNNSSLKLPIGSQVQATLFAAGKKASWLPETALVNLGLNQVVFKKEDAGFRAHKIQTGMKQNGKVLVITGLSEKDSVATNAQFLVGSESFIHVKD